MCNIRRPHYFYLLSTMGSGCWDTVYSVLYFFFSTRPFMLHANQQLFPTLSVPPEGWRRVHSVLEAGVTVAFLINCMVFCWYWYYFCSSAERNHLRNPTFWLQSAHTYNKSTQSHQQHVVLLIKGPLETLKTSGIQTTQSHPVVYVS